MQNYPYRTCVEVDLDKLERNLVRLRALIGPDCRIMEVLKADAYGHGLRLCSRTAAPFVDWFATATLEEALAVREETSTPILLLGQLQDHEIPVAVRNHITLNISSLPYALHIQSLLSETDLTADGHIKIETGMNRLGFRARPGQPEEAVKAAAAVFSLPRIHITGIYTHFACADSDDEEDRSFTEDQFLSFCQVCSGLTDQGLDIGIRHCASTGGLLCHPAYRLDMVRTGMFPLGQSISEDSARQLGLEPILTWYARVIDIRDIPAGESVSYGRAYTFPKPSRIAVLSAGYADGYARALTNRTQVILGGKKVPLRGKICMDFMMADITDGPDVSLGDQAILLGREGSQWISADYLAEKAGPNTNGGITTAITARVPRIYVRHGEVAEIRKIVY